MSGKSTRIAWLWHEDPADGVPAKFDGARQRTAAWPRPVTVARFLVSGAAELALLHLSGPAGCPLLPDFMIQFFRQLFDTDGFPPRWTCGQWTGGHGWLHILSDVAIFGAYAAIPLILVYFVRKRRDVPFVPIFGLFALFIVCCGLTHLIDASIFWHPWYRLSGTVKAITAVVSWMTVLALFKVVPQALTLPGLAKMNRRLLDEIAEREQAEAARRESEERLGFVAERAQVGYWHWEPALDRLEWSPQCRRLFGISPTEEMTYARFLDALHPEDRARTDEAVAACLEGGGEADYDIEFRTFLPDGTLRWVHSKGSAVFREGKAVRMAGIALDITAGKAAEAALRRSEERLRLATDAAELGIWAWEPEADLVTWENNWLHAMLGLPAHAPAVNAGRFKSEILHPEDRQAFEETIADTMRSGSRFQFKGRILRPDGIPRWIEFSGKPSRGPDDGPLTFIGTARNVTEQELAGRSLRIERERLSLALTAGQMGVYDWTMKDDHLWWSPETYTLFGVEPANYVPTVDGFRALIHPEDRKGLWQRLNGCMNRRESFAYEFRVLRPDGSLRWVGNRAEFEYDAKGVPVRNYGVAIDITTQKAAEKTLRENAQLFATLIEHAPGGVYVVDEHFRIQSINSKALPVFASVQPLIGRDFEEVMEILWGRETGARLSEIFQHTLTTGEQYISPPFKATREDLGIEQAYDWETQRIMLPDGQYGVVCYFSDVTERHRSEAALQQAKDAAEAANRSKDHFLAVLSHELRTPLTPVLMAAGELERHPHLPAEVREDIVMIKRNVELETKLIDDLLDLSRITSGKVELKTEPLEFGTIVREVCTICRPEFLEKGITLEVEAGPAPCRITADPARLHQVLWNIVRNAVKFSPGGGRILVSLRHAGPGWCELRVQDNGIGIPPELLDRVFKAFEQGDSRITRQFGGLGLGLAISRALMELHGGQIRAESPGAGGGATFILRLPLSDERASSAALTTTAPDPALPAGIHLLLVEDHADTAGTLRRLLQNRGLTVVTARTVAEAVACAGRETFDILLTDLGLPDGSGYEVMERVRRHRKIPGIAMSGYGMEEDLRRSAEAGFAEHLIKPVSIGNLMAAIRRLMADRARD